MKSLLALVLAFVSTAAFPAAKVTLAWDAVVANDLAGYRVYQSQIKGVYNKTADKVCDVGATVTTCAPIVNDGNYYWVVTSYDTHGNESGFSGEVNTAVDTAAPPIPQALRVISVQLQ